MYCSACGERTELSPCTSCGAEPLLDGRYRLEEVLGRGAGATTWRATIHDLGGERSVAIKESLLPQHDADKTAQLVKREADVLRQLSHPQIPAFIESIVAGAGKARSLYLVQQHIDGVDLRRHAESHRYSEPEVLDVLHSLCSVLDYLHGLSPPVVHRDIKPANVILRDDGALVLVDFGAVRDALRDAQLGGSTVAGTFGYMAPEQFAGDASPRSDLFGLGALAVALLTRKDPATLAGNDRRVRWRQHAAVSEPTAELLDELLAIEPGDRPPTALAVATRIDRIRSDTRQMTLRLPAVDLPTKKRPAGSALRWLVLPLVLLGIGGFGATTLAALAGGALGWFTLRAPSQPENVAACRRYVEAFDTVPCAVAELNADDLCPPQLDRLPCDMVAYYDCMAEAVTCNGDFFDVSGQARCSMPSCR